MTKIYYYNEKLMKKITKNKVSKKEKIKDFISNILFFVVAFGVTLFIFNYKGFGFINSDKMIIQIIEFLLMYLIVFFIIALLRVLLEFLLAILKSIINKILGKDSGKRYFSDTFRSNFARKNKIKLVLADDKMTVLYEYLEVAPDLTTVAYGIDTIYYSDIKRIVYTPADFYIHIYCKYTFNKTLSDYNRIYKTYDHEGWYNFCLLFEDAEGFLKDLALKANFQIEKIYDEKYDL